MSLRTGRSREPVGLSSPSRPRKQRGGERVSTLCFSFSSSSWLPPFQLKSPTTHVSITWISDVYRVRTLSMGMVGFDEGQKVHDTSHCFLGGTKMFKVRTPGLWAGYFPKEASPVFTPTGPTGSPRPWLCD